MKAIDLQFIRYFFINELNLKENTPDLFSTDIQIQRMGEPDTLVNRSNSIIYSNPSSITRFLFNIIYSLVSRHINHDFARDKMGLGLLFMCRDYVYKNYEFKDITKPPVLIDFDKLPIPAFILRELVEPLIGQTKKPFVLFMQCSFTDTCRVIMNEEKLSKDYNLPLRSVSFHNFPILLCNSSIYNEAAQMSDILFRTLELSVGTDKTHKILKNILLNTETDLLGRLILILKMFNGDPEFILDFVGYLESNLQLTDEEMNISSELKFKAVASDDYLNRHIKIAAEKHTPTVFKQWSQWSMLMGLIEKQLGPMRGSMWPATENLGPHENNFRALVQLKAKEKNKNQLNYEELLETARDLYDHNAVEPGKLIEIMLKDNRVWKI